MENQNVNITPSASNISPSSDKLKITPREFFILWGILISLYSSVSAFITIMFTVLNKAMPDTLDYSGYYGNGIASLSVPISILIIMFPIFTVLNFFYNKSLKTNPERLSLKLRKFAIYLTLFLCALMIATDLIVLVQYFLKGEITSRFLWKVLVIIVTAVLVGSYYLNQINKKDEDKTSRNLIFGIIAWVIVIATFVYAFSVFGSPKNQRALTLDQQRISNLQQIESLVLNYWQQNKVLPAALDDMQSVPKDPEAISGKTLEYNKVGDLSYTVCADFSASSPSDQEMNYLYGQNSYPNQDQFVPKGMSGYPWKHGKGHTCFERVIDTALYKPYNGY